MRIRFVRAIVLAGAAAASAAAPAMAQNREKAWELYPAVGFVMFGDKAGLDDKPSIEFSFAYHPSKKHEVEFGFGGVSSKDTATHQFSADLVNIRANYVYNIFLQHRDKVVAYLTAGGGLLNFSTFGFTTNADLVGDEVDLMYNYGAGLRFFGGEKAGFRIEARQVRYSTNHGGPQEYTEVTLGLSLVLGGA